MRQQIVIVILVMIVLIFMTFPKKEEPTYVNEQAITVTPFEVHVMGEVMMPNTYYYFEPVTVYDVIQQAGGLTNDADDLDINYRDIIEDDMTLTIPSKDNIDEPNIEKVNINDANFAQLIEVPFLSETIAAYIIMYREEHGDFQSLDDLILVKYIGAATLEKIKPYLSLS